MDELKHCSGNLDNSVLSSTDSPTNHHSSTDSSTNSSINRQLQQLRQPQQLQQPRQLQQLRQHEERPTSQTQPSHPTPKLAEQHDLPALPAPKQLRNAHVDHSPDKPSDDLAQETSKSDSLEQSNSHKEMPVT